MNTSALEREAQPLTSTHAGPSSPISAAVCAFLALGCCLFLELVWKLVRGLNQGFVLSEGHHWRQAFNFGVILNFASGSAEWLVPRMLALLPHSSGKTNIVAMEAPLYHWILALPTRWSHQAIWPARLFALLSLLLFVGVLSRIVKASGFTKQTNSLTVAAVLFVVALSPMVAIEFRQVQSEAPMVALASIAFWLGNTQPTRGALRRALFGFVCVLMVLMKPSALAYLPALCWLGVRGSASRREKLVHCGLVLGASVAHVVWMRWAWHLLRTYNPAGPIISIQIDLANVWQNLCTPSSYVYLTSFVLPSVVTGYWLFPAGVLGLFHFVYQLRRRSCSVMDEAMGLALVLALIELICFGDRLANNLYYGLVLLLPSMYFTVQGVRLFASTLQNAPQTQDRWLRFVGWSVVLASVAPALRLRHVNTFNSAASAAQGVIENRFVWDFSNIWSVVTMLGVLLGATLLSRVRSPGGWQRSVQVACLTVGASLVGSQYRADQLQWREIYAGGEERAATTRQLATIREAVELFSTPSQLLGTNHLELAVLAELRRNGEVNLQPPDRRSRQNPAVDLYLFFGEERLRTGYPQLAIGRDWQLFCLRAGGCQ